TPTAHATEDAGRFGRVVRSPDSTASRHSAQPRSGPFYDRSIRVQLSTAHNSCTSPASIAMEVPMLNRCCIPIATLSVTLLLILPDPLSADTIPLMPIAPPHALPHHHAGPPPHGAHTT